MRSFLRYASSRSDLAQRSRDPSGVATNEARGQRAGRLVSRGRLRPPTLPTVLLRVAALLLLLLLALLRALPPPQLVSLLLSGPESIE